MTMTSRERLAATLRREPTDRIPMLDVSYWPETIARWEHEGLAPGADVRELLGLDRIVFADFNTGLCRPEQVLEETTDHLIKLDRHGRKVKEWKSVTATPVYLEFPLREPGDWARYREGFDLDFRQRFLGTEAEFATGAARGDFRAICPIEPAWYFIEYLFGFEEGLTWLLTDPAGSAQILNEYTDWLLELLEQILAKSGMAFDGLWFSADLCYRNGMLFSPTCYRELVLPLHRRFRQFCDRHGLAMMLHCDGDVREFIPLVIEAGFELIQPVEARAGNDVRLLKPLYGDRITFQGNINADVIATGDRCAIEAEVRTKVLAAKVGGGYMYHIDHSVPPTVSYADYCYMIDLVKKYGEY